MPNHRGKCRALWNFNSPIPCIDMSKVRISIPVEPRNAFHFKFEDLFTNSSMMLREEYSIEDSFRYEFNLVFTMFLVVPEKSRETIVEIFSYILAQNISPRRYRYASFQVLIEMYGYATASLDTTFRRLFYKLYRDNKEVFKKVLGCDQYVGAVNIMGVIISWYKYEFLYQQKSFGNFGVKYAKERRKALGIE